MHRIYCWPRELGGHKVERGVFICGHAGLQCSFTIKTDNRGDLPRNARPTLSGCDRRLYVVHNPASDQVLTVAATYEEIIRIQRERMSEFEALHYLGVIVPPGVRA